MPLPHRAMLILTNARIHTLDPEQPRASALAIEDLAPHGGRVVAVGETEKLLAEFGARAEVEDMGGKLILPGLTDSHVHLRSYALFLKHLDLGGLTRAECLRLVSERVQTQPPGAWIRGHGWNQNNWPEGFGNPHDLDAAAPEHPVYLSATSMHAGWANAAALRVAGVNSNTPDPHDGAFQRDESGKPTGILYEAAMDAVANAIPTPTEEESVRAIREAQEVLWRWGVTGVHDFDRIRSFEALQTLHGRGELKLRVLKHLPVERLQHIIETGLRSGFGDDVLRIGAIKIFSDGALGPHTAAMFQPYEDEPENRGMLFTDREELFEHFRRAALNGLRMTVHAIGDRANHEVLAAYAQLRAFEKENGLPARRHRLEHAQIVHPDDFPRFAELNIVASVQPIHATSDMLMADRYWGERSRTAYAYRTLLDHGTMLAFGSDAPVDSPNPFRGLHAAVTRRRADGSPGPEGWYPEQRLTLAEALQGYTQSAAYIAGMDDRLGCLAPGYLADLIVLEQDPFEIPADDLREVSPVGTMVGGEWVWRE